MEVAAGDEPALLEQRRDPLAGGAGVRRRLDHDELAGLQDAAQRPGRRHQRAEVRLAVGRQRCRHADEHRVAARERLRVAGGLDAIGDGGEPVGRDVLDVRLATADAVDLARVRVECGDVVAGLRERDGERQPDVAQAHDSDVHSVGSVGTPSTGSTIAPRAPRARPPHAVPGPLGRHGDLCPRTRARARPRPARRAGDRARERPGRRDARRPAPAGARRRGLPHGRQPRDAAARHVVRPPRAAGVRPRRPGRDRPRPPPGDDPDSAGSGRGARRLAQRRPAPRAAGVLLARRADVPARRLRPRRATRGPRPDAVRPRARPDRRAAGHRAARVTAIPCAVDHDRFTPEPDERDAALPTLPERFVSIRRTSGRTRTTSDCCARSPA